MSFTETDSSDTWLMLLHAGDEELQLRLGLKTLLQCEGSSFAGERPHLDTPDCAVLYHPIWDAKPLA